MLLGLRNQILRLVISISSHSIEEGKSIPRRNTDLRAALTSGSCFATNDGTDLSPNQVDNAPMDAVCLDVQQDALWAVQLADHKKLSPPMRLLA